MLTAVGVAVGPTVQFLQAIAHKAGSVDCHRLKPAYNEAKEDEVGSMRKFFDNIY